MKAEDKMTEVKPEKPEIEVNLEVGQKPKRQRLMTDYHMKIPVEQEQVQVEGGDLETPVEDPDPGAQKEGGGNQEVEALRTLLAEEKMIKRPEGHGEV